MNKKIQPSEPANHIAVFQEKPYAELGMEIRGGSLLSTWWRCLPIPFNQKATSKIYGGVTKS